MREANGSVKGTIVNGRRGIRLKDLVEGHGFALLQGKKDAIGDGQVRIIIADEEVLAENAQYLDEVTKGVLPRETCAEHLTIALRQNLISIIHVEMKLSVRLSFAIRCVHFILGLEEVNDEER